MTLLPEDLPSEVEHDGPESNETQQSNTKISDCSSVITAKYRDPQNKMLMENSTQEQQHLHETFPENCITCNGKTKSDGGIEGSSPIAKPTDKGCSDKDDLNFLDEGVKKLELTPKGPGSDKCKAQSKEDGVHSLEKEFEKIELTPKGPGRIDDGGFIAGVPTVHNHLSYKTYGNPLLTNVNVTDFPSYSRTFQPNHMNSEQITPGRRKRDDQSEQPWKFMSGNNLSQPTREQFPLAPNNNTQAFSMGRAFPCENDDDSVVPDRFINQPQNVYVRETSTSINPSIMSGGSVTVKEDVNAYDEDQILTDLLDSLDYSYPDNLSIEPDPRLGSYPTSSNNIYGNGDLSGVIDLNQCKTQTDYRNISTYPTTQALPPYQQTTTNHMLQRDHDSFDSNHGDTRSEGYVTSSPYSESQCSPESSLNHDSPLNSPPSPSNYNSPPPTNLSVQSVDSGISGSPKNNDFAQQNEIKEETEIRSCLDGREEELSVIDEILAKDLRKAEKVHNNQKVTNRDLCNTSQSKADTPKMNGINIPNSHHTHNSGHMTTEGVKIKQPSTTKPVVIVPPGPQPVILMAVTQPQQQTVLVPVSNTSKSNKKQQPVKRVNRTPREIRPKPLANPPDSIPTESQKLSSSNVRNNTDSSFLSSMASTPPMKPEFKKSVACPPTVPVKQDIPRSSIPSQTTQRQQSDTKINLARRCVAGVRTDELRMRDDDGDTNLPQNLYSIIRSNLYYRYLHVSIYKADIFMLQALLERLGREGLQDMMDAKNSLMQTPLYMAVSENQPGMVHLLIQHNVDVNVYAQVKCGEQNSHFQGAIHYAASKGVEYLTTLNELLKAPGIKLDLQNSEGKTALHCAILAHLRPSVRGNECINSIPIVEALMRAGADPDITSGIATGGKTPLMYAVETKDVYLIKSMVQLIDPNKMPQYLRTSTYNGFTVLKILESMRQSFKDDMWLYIRDLFYRADRQENGLRSKT